MMAEMERMEMVKVRVQILAGPYRIKGLIALIPGARVTDFLVESEAFIAVTDGEVWDLEGRKILSAPFFNVSREHVVVLVPDQG
jgi:hypothetical protein